MLRPGGSDFHRVFVVCSSSDQHAAPGGRWSTSPATEKQIPGRARDDAGSGQFDHSVQLPEIGIPNRQVPAAAIAFSGHGFTTGGLRPHRRISGAHVTKT